MKFYLLLPEFSQGLGIHESVSENFWTAADRGWEKQRITHMGLHYLLYCLNYFSDAYIFKSLLNTSHPW